MEKEKLIPQTGFIEFRGLRTRKGKASPTSSFGCRMLARQDQEESDLMPDKSVMVVIAHNNGNKTRTLLRSGDYC